MTLGSKVIGSEVAKIITRLFLGSDFQGSRSVPKIERIMEYENQFLNNSKENK